MPISVIRGRKLSLAYGAGPSPGVWLCHLGHSKPDRGRWRLPPSRLPSVVARGCDRACHAPRPLSVWPSARSGGDFFSSSRSGSPATFSRQRTSSRHHTRTRHAPTPSRCTAHKLMHAHARRHACTHARTHEITSAHECHVAHVADVLDTTAEKREKGLKDAVHT